MSTEFKIEKKIPIPGLSYFSVKNRYPFREMKVGDSFMVHAQDKEETMLISNRVRQSACVFSRRNPDFRFLTRQVILPDGKKAVRIWRIDVALAKARNEVQP